MIVHIVQAGCIGDSYKSIILATLDGTEAQKLKDEYNEGHPDPYDIQYEVFTVPLRGLPEVRREIILARVKEAQNKVSAGT